VRWGVELATWLARSTDATDNDRQLLARGLRLIAERTPAANIRNWAITRARHLDGQTPMDRFMRHGFSAKAIAHASSVDLVHTMRVLLDPQRALGVHGHVRFVVEGEAAGLHVRNCVAVPTDGVGAEAEVSMMVCCRYRHGRRARGHRQGETLLRSSGLHRLNPS
jgi:alkyl sulfatase BDS1-like metallo-beta-lactamase superfamily hydrolase